MARAARRRRGPGVARGAVAVLPVVLVDAIRLHEEAGVVRSVNDLWVVPKARPVGGDYGQPLPAWLPPLPASDIR